ncbi:MULTISPECIES: S8 family serine peptidase [Microbacterium]|uniref:S8 family serine peptidase n=1 Tax=Microbacterium TaxID=33882 RepID=UPI001EF655A0|nr:MULTISPECIES: S8 family serine peptidase [Microbacterium]
MFRRPLAVVGALALAIATPTAAMAAAPEDDPTPKLEQSETSGPVGTSFRPHSVGADGRVTVIVEMAGDPTAVTEAKKGAKLSKSERSAIKQSLKAAQDAIGGTLESKGGKIQAKMQSAYNGIQVSIPAEEVDAVAALPNVVAVHPVKTYTLDNAVSVPFLGVHDVWQDTGYTGENIKVAIIDTGVDYTHANFGGAGTVDAYNAARAAEAQPADPAQFGPEAPRVKGGWDFVGDTYNADPDSPDYQPVPKPDANPLDCNGHGSHVAGTAAGSGVADGETYAGPYDSTTPSQTFDIGPGVAPEADVYALRVFGCGGSTDVVVPAIDWAVDNDMDVINMSLGSPFGRGDDADEVAAANAVGAGVVVVKSAGNEGPSPYLAGNGNGVVSVAAVDSTESFPGATITVDGVAIPAINANGAVLTGLPGMTVVRLTDDPATPNENEALGCSTEAYTKAGVAPGGNQLAVSTRGTCARVAKAVFAQKAGAAAAVMINSTNDFPPFEGAITENPDTGEQYTVTIPFLGVRLSDGPKLVDDRPATVVASPLANPGFRGYASFSSAGPRSGDSALGVDVAAPGVSIVSTGVGTGSGPATISGTSMAAPHVAGVAALAVQAHPAWSAAEVSSVLVATADPEKVAGQNPVRGGVGLVDPAQAVAQQVTATGDSFKTDDGKLRETALNFGFQESRDAFQGKRKTVTLTNYGSEAVTYTVSAQASAQSESATVSVSPSQLTVPAGRSAKVTVTLDGSTATVGSSTVGGFAFYEFSGDVVFTSAADTLRVPYLLVPRSTTDVSAKGDLKVTKKSQPVDGEVSVALTNKKGALAGGASFYTWGLEDRKDAPKSFADTGYDLRAAGVRSFLYNDELGELVVFALNTHNRWSNAASNQYEVHVDTDRDGEPNWIVYAADGGLVTAGSVNGIIQVFAYDVAAGVTYATGFNASAPTDSSTILLPVFAADLGLTEESGTFDYAVQASSLVNDGSDVMDGVATYNPFAPALSNSQSASVPVGGTIPVPVVVDAEAFTEQKPLGVMVVAMDNPAGAGEAILVKAK